MATASTPESQQHAQLQSSRTLFQGLLVGSILLLLYSLWLRTAQPDVALGESLVLWAFVAAGVVLGFWHLNALRRAQSTGFVEELVRQRRLVGLIVSGAGFALLVLAGYLGYQLGRAGLGESLGLGLFALFLLSAGLAYCLQRPAGADSFLNALSSSYGLIRNLLFALGVLLMILFAYLTFGAKIGVDYAPELIILVFQSLICLVAAVWLSVARESERSPAGFRVFLLIVGGFTGFLVTLEAVLRAYLWRQDVFLGGLSVWQGEQGWKFWLCAYIALVGLVLMFGSVLIARADIRSSAQLRQVLFGYNFVFTTLLLLAFLAVFNVAFYAMFPMTFEWTRTRGLVTLSGATKNLLQGLKEPTTIYVLMSQSHPIFSDMRAMLGNSQVQTDKLQVKYISPERDFRDFEDLAQRYPELLPSARVARLDAETGRGVLIVYGAETADAKAKVPHAFIPLRKLFEDSGGFHQQKEAKPTRIFKGELEVMKELNFLAQGQKQRKIYFVQGNGELDVNNRDFARFRDPRADLAQLGAQSLFERLKKDNYDPHGFSFDRPPLKEAKEKSSILYAPESGPEKRKDIPEDAWAIVVAGPSKDFSREALDALQRYMDRGGKLLATVDIVLDNTLTKLKKSNFEDFLKKYGVEVEDKYVLRVVSGKDPRDVHVTSPLTSTNELAKQYWNQAFQFSTPRIVRPDPKATKYKGEIFLEAHPEVAGDVMEADVGTLRNPIVFLNDLNRRGLLRDKLSDVPLPMAVTVTEDGAKPRLVVFGDTDFISNLELRASEDAYYNLFVSSLEWMAERGGFVGPMPKETPSYQLPRTPQLLNRLLILPGWFMTLALFGLGIGIWVVRRR